MDAMPYFSHRDIPPEIVFKYNYFLNRRGRTVEIPDIIPNEFEAIINLSLSAIKRQLLYLQGDSYQPVINAAYTHSLKLGRLAVTNKESYVLTEPAYQKFLPGQHKGKLWSSTRMEDLTKDYYPYWEIIKDASLNPVIESGIRHLHPDINGTWLGISLEK